MSEKEMSTTTNSGPTAVGHIKEAMNIVKDKTSENFIKQTESVKQFGASALDVIWLRYINTKESMGAFFASKRTRRWIAIIGLSAAIGGVLGYGIDRFINNPNNSTPLPTPTEEACPAPSFEIPGVERGDKGYWNKDGIELPEIGASEGEAREAYDKWFNEVADQDPINLLGNAKEINKTYLNHYTRKNINGKFDRQIDEEKLIQELIDFIDTMRADARKTGNFDPGFGINDENHCATDYAIQLRTYILSKQFTATVGEVSAKQATEFNNSYVHNGEIAFDLTGEDTTGQKVLWIKYLDADGKPLTEIINGQEEDHITGVVNKCANVITRKETFIIVNHKQDNNKPEEKPEKKDPKKDVSQNKNVDKQLKDAGSKHEVNKNDGSKDPKGLQTDPKKDAGKTEEKAEAVNKKSQESHEEAKDQAKVVETKQDNTESSAPSSSW
jgi:hypothetical protein